MHGLILLLGLLVFVSGKGYAEMSSFEDNSCDPATEYCDYSKSEESYEDSKSWESRKCDPSIWNCFRINYSHDKNPVDGGWTPWSTFGRCSVTCGTGDLQLLRYCRNPRPKNGGKQCIGPSRDQIPCTRKICPGTGRAPGGGYQRVGAPGGYLGAWAQPGVPAQPYIGTAGDPGFGYPAVGAPGGYLGAWAPPAAPGNLPGGILGRIFGVAPGGRPGGIPGGIPGVAPGGAPAPPVDPKVYMWLQAMDQDNSGHIDLKELGQALANGMGHFSVDRLEGNAANTRNWKRK